MDARSIIAALRRGDEPTRAALRWFAAGLADGRVSDAQAGAFAMAVCLRGLGAEGRAALTLAMRDTGEVLRWPGDLPVIDKHSTGGVGDCVSLVLAPALAACGALVPMISGRGLGHTGGTLDKLESIPGVNTDCDAPSMRRILGAANCAIVGAGDGIAPADRRLYAIRDVTATVESLDLITASILSKKLAAGPGALVLDVKLGSGAFMKTLADAQALARALCETATAAGCPAQALITDMEQPLVPALGNALEVAEALTVLDGGQAGRLRPLCAALGGSALHTGGLADSAAQGAERIEAALDSGAAAERFFAMIAAMGGPGEFERQRNGLLPEAPVIREVPAPADGIVTRIEGEALGLIVVGLGGGRQVEGDRVDPAVGLSDIAPLGSRMVRGQPLARVHAGREAAADRAAAALLRAISLGDEPPGATPLIHERIGG